MTSLNRQTASHALYGVAAHTEKLSTLRSELAGHAREQFWSTAEGLNMLDGFIKESVPMSPMDASMPSLLSMTRVVHVQLLTSAQSPAAARRSRLSRSPTAPRSTPVTGPACLNKLCGKTPKTSPNPTASIPSASPGMAKNHHLNSPKYPKLGQCGDSGVRRGKSSSHAIFTLSKNRCRYHHHPPLSLIIPAVNTSKS